MIKSANSDGGDSEVVLSVVPPLPLLFLLGEGRVLGICNNTECKWRDPISCADRGRKKSVPCTKIFIFGVCVCVCVYGSGFTEPGVYLAQGS